MKRGAKVQISQLDPEGASSSCSSGEEVVEKKPPMGRVISIPSRRTQEIGNIINPFKSMSTTATTKATASGNNSIKTTDKNIIMTREDGLKERESILCEIEKLNYKFVAAVNASHTNDRHTDFTSLFPQYTKYREEIQKHFGLLKETMSKLSSSALEVEYEREKPGLPPPSPPKTQINVAPKETASSPMKIDHPAPTKPSTKPVFSFPTNHASNPFSFTQQADESTRKERPTTLEPQKPFSFIPATPSETKPFTFNPSSNETKPSAFNVAATEFKPLNTPSTTNEPKQPTLSFTDVKPFTFSAPTSGELKPFSINTSSATTTNESKPSSSAESKPFTFNTLASEAKPLTFNLSTGETKASEINPLTFNAPTSSEAPKPFSFVNNTSESSMKPFSFPSTSTSQFSFSFNNSTTTQQPIVPSKEADQEESDDAEPPTLPEEPLNKELVQKGEGEEGEVTEWQARSKLFRLENDAWKDLGIGLAKVNQQQQEGKRRLLMRAEGTGKVLLNVDLKGIIADYKQERSSEIIMITSHDGAKYLLRSKEQMAPLDQILKNSATAQSNKKDA